MTNQRDIHGIQLTQQDMVEINGILMGVYWENYECDINEDMSGQYQQPTSYEMSLMSYYVMEKFPIIHSDSYDDYQSDCNYVIIIPHYNSP